MQLIEDNNLHKYLSSNVRKSIKQRFSQKIFYKHLIKEYDKEINQRIRINL